MATRKIFVSYDYVNDANYKNLLVAWAKNRDFVFSMNDKSVDVSVDGTDAAAIKRVVANRIHAATYFLCLIGKDTHRSKWIAWEIATAVKLKKRLVVVKIDKGSVSPAGLLNQGASWAFSFTLDGITKRLGAA